MHQTAGSALMSEARGVPGAGSYEAQIYSDAWGQGEADSGEEDALAKVDRALAMEVNIPLDHKGELVAFREVRLWKVPSQGDLTKLKNRINDEWIKPLNLKQQDIVRASGLGAPYVCYLLKDPNSPNMNRRRKIEAFSVLTELFRKYDQKVVTKEDFIRLRNQRVANRFQGPRQDRSGRNANGTAAGRQQQKRRRRRPGPYGEEDVDDDDDGSQLDDEVTDPSARLRRKRRALYAAQAAGQMGYYGDPSGMMHGGGAKGFGGYPGNLMQQMMQAGGYSPQMMAPSYPQPQPWIASANVPYWPTHHFVYAMARGQKQNELGEVIDTPEGVPFQAPYPAGFPPVLRTIVSMNNVVDGPPPSLMGPDKQGGVASAIKGHDTWVRQKVSQLAKPVVVPKSENGQPIFREPNVHSFVFLVDKSSCLLPIGVKVATGATGDLGDLWDIRALRRDAEASEWLDENRDWDDSLWVLWDIKETGTSVQALFDKWRQDHKLSDEDLGKVAKCFLSQYVYLRDVELGFQALLQHAPSNEDFCRNVEINCDLLEERIRVKDAFVWDIRASDWDLTALLSNFVSDFQLDSPAISSLFIDLKTTILRYRKEWVSTMLERLTAEGKIDASRYLPNTLGFEHPSALS